MYWDIIQENTLGAGIVESSTRFAEKRIDFELNVIASQSDIGDILFYGFFAHFFRSFEQFFPFPINYVFVRLIIVLFFCYYVSVLVLRSN